MLVSLSIRNFVLIEDAELEFHPGLNVLTGETGAGKTLLTRALGLLMGERAEEGLVGQAGPEAVIQAVFAVEESEIAEVPYEIRELLGGITPGELLVTRRLGREGRNRSFINDSAVTLGAMASVVSGLLSFAGQHEYRRLLDPRYQQEVLDRWAGAEVEELAGRFRETFLQAREASRRLEEGRRTREARRRDLELLRYQVDELARARLSLEEEEALVSEQRMLSRAEEIVAAAGMAAELLRSENDEADAVGATSRAAALLGSLRGVDQALDALATELTDLGCRLGEVARDLRTYASRVNVDPARLEQVNDRLRLYTDLARKYGGSTAEALRYQQQAQEQLAALEQTEEDLAQLQDRQSALVKQALELAAELTARRKQAAPLLEEAVARQLEDLGMTSASVQVAVSSRGSWEELKETGADYVEFLLQANPGQPARSLARTASGGELSRVLLAIKCALAGAGGSETLVFDEIDAGIGGRTAVAVANKLRELAREAQLIVVTHLPQVAAVAARHFLIDKVSDGSTTVARLSRLEGEDVVRELCRMLGGRPSDAEAMAHARDLRDRAVRGLLD